MLDSEKEIILRAIHELHSSTGDYCKGIYMLCDLIELKAPYVIFDGVHQINLSELRLKKNYFDDN
jgi:hypothetical protein